MKLLTIDLEDWFHILSFGETARPDQWSKFDSRIVRSADWILEQLSVTNQRATFFCLGWIAAKHPGLIKKIAGQGHEIACHSMNHQLVFTQTPEEFRKDLAESIQILQDLAGKKISTYRAPGFSLTEATKWVFSVLGECGIENDCSIFPARRNHGGYPAFPHKTPCIVSVHGARLHEFPMSVASFMGKQLVFSGGGYFRLLPYSFISRLMNASEYVMTYFHPRDFDADQPLLKSLPLKRRFMSYTGLRRAGSKFQSLLHDFRFSNISDVAETIDWKNVPAVSVD